MFVHFVVPGVADSSLGVGLDVVGSATRIVKAGLSALRRGEHVLQQRVLSLDGRPVRSGTNREVSVDGKFNPRALGRGDVVIVPGMFAPSEGSIETLLARDETKRALELLAKASAAGAMLAASCCATFVLAGSGVLDGKKATTTWWLAPVFARRFPKVELTAERMVVDAGKVLTAGSAFAHADLMLAVLARVAGPSLAHLVTRYLVIDERTSQSRYMVMEHLRVSDPAVRAVERFVADNVSRQIGLDELARVAAVSSRTLARKVHAALGMTPHELVQRVRVNHAAHLLETSGTSVEQVAQHVGYADAAAFRRVFRRYSGESPRRRTRAASAA